MTVYYQAQPLGGRRERKLLEGRGWGGEGGEEKRKVINREVLKGGFDSRRRGNEPPALNWTSENMGCTEQPSRSTVGPPLPNAF